MKLLENVHFLKFLPSAKSSATIDTVKRSKLVVLFSIFYAGCGSVFAPTYFILGSPIGSQAILLSDIFILFAPILLKRTGSYLIAGQWILLHVYWLLAFLAYVNGGFGGPSLVWLVSLPIAASIMGGKKCGFFWLGMSCVQWVVFFTLFQLEFQFPQHFSIEGMILTHFISLMGLTVLVYAFSHLYEIFNDESFTLIESASITDDLTRCMNRRGFFNIVAQKRREAMRKKESMHFVYIDLDGLKKINDTFGHAEGDKAISHCASILKSTLRESDVIGRIGGDEFAVLNVFEPPTTPSPEKIMERISKSFEQFNQTKTLPYLVSVSAGVMTWAPDDPSDISKILVLADKEMYKKKLFKKTLSRGA